MPTQQLLFLMRDCLPVLAELSPLPSPGCMSAAISLDTSRFLCRSIAADTAQWEAPAGHHASGFQWNGCVRCTLQRGGERVSQHPGKDSSSCFSRLVGDVHTDAAGSRQQAGCTVRSKSVVCSHRVQHCCTLPAAAAGRMHRVSCDAKGLACVLPASP